MLNLVLYARGLRVAQMGGEIIRVSRTTFWMTPKRKNRREISKKLLLFSSSSSFVFFFSISSPLIFFIRIYACTCIHARSLWNSLFVLGDDSDRACGERAFIKEPLRGVMKRSDNLIDCGFLSPRGSASLASAHSFFFTSYSLKRVCMCL